MFRILKATRTNEAFYWTRVSLFMTLPGCNPHDYFPSGRCQFLIVSAPQNPAVELPPPLLPFSDLDHFKVHTRSGVSVREGQGVVLLCGTPTSSGGETSPYPALESAFREVFGCLRV